MKNTSVPENQSPAQRLRELLEGGDVRALAGALADPGFPESLRLQMLREMPRLTAVQRILLRDPARAEAVLRHGPASEASASGNAPSGNAPSADDPRTIMEKALFKAGAAHPLWRERLIGMELVPDRMVASFGTDGLAFYYREALPAGEGKAFVKKLPAVTSADVQHMLMHCVFRHMIPEEKAWRPLWDLACDMAAEYLRADFFPGHDAAEARILVAGNLPSGTEPRDAASVYRAIMDLYEDELELLTARFSRDDHRYWYERPAVRGRAPGAAFPEESGSLVEQTSERKYEPELPQENAPAESDEINDDDYTAWLAERVSVLWPGCQEETAASRETTGRYGLIPGSREEKMLLRAEAKYDFSRYLRRFSTTREEIRLDPDGFDYIPYYYGLKRYGNMPLIEPLEYTESHKVEDLVIAIDTSGSCTRSIVERFLAEIERILMRSEFFFRKMNVHIIQCDAIIQSHDAIRSLEQWKRYTKDLTIRGRGGTNFTPVFELVGRLIEKGDLRHLKGLLYFTDGDGVYPKQEPPYETAFVFTTREALGRAGVPDWIIPLCLDMTPEETGRKLQEDGTARKRRHS